MDKKDKVKIITIVAVLILVIIIETTCLIVLCLKDNNISNKNNTVGEVEEKIIYDTSYIPKGLEISNVNVSKGEGELNYAAKVSNTTNKPIYVKEITIIIKDSERNIIAELNIQVNADVKANSFINISAGSGVSNNNEYKDIIYIFKTE